MSKEKSSKAYTKHPRKYWIGLYMIAGIIVYGLVYLFLVHHGAGNSNAAANLFNYGD